MILITGSTGFLGKHVAADLSKKYRIRCLVRKKSKKEDIGYLKKLRAEIIYGDVTDYDSLVKAAEGISTAIHLATAPSASGYNEFYSVHVNGARNIIKACRANGIRRVVVASSVAALAKEKSDYGLTKGMADRLFLKSGLDITILRPGFIYGKGGGLEKLVNIIRRYPLIPIIGSGTYNKQPVYVKDVIAAINACLRKRKTIGKIFNVCGNDVTFEEMVDILCKELGIRKRKIHIPKFVFMAAAVMPKQNSMLTKTVVMGMVHDSNVRSDLKRLGITPIGFEEGLRSVIKHYR